MPMIDVYATVGTFKDPKSLARDLAETLMKIEQVPDIPMFRNNTAAFIHDLRMAPSLTSMETATTSGCRSSPMRARSTERSSLPLSASSPTWSRLRPEIPQLRRGPGCSFPRRSKVGGALRGTPTPTRSLSTRRVRRSPSCKRPKALAAEARPMEQAGTATSSRGQIPWRLRHGHRSAFG